MSQKKTQYASPIHGDRRRKTRLSIPESLNNWLRTMASTLHISRLIVSDAHGILVASSHGNARTNPAISADEFWDPKCLEIAAFTPIALRNQLNLTANLSTSDLSELMTTPVNVEDEHFILACIGTDQRISADRMRDMQLGVHRILSS